MQKPTTQTLASVPPAGDPFRTRLSSEEFWDRYAGPQRCADHIHYSLIAAGFDGVIAPDEVVAFDPRQIKSADPIIRTPGGDVVPLARRFSSENPNVYGL